MAAVYTTEQVIWGFILKTLWVRLILSRASQSGKYCIFPDDLGRPGFLTESGRSFLFQCSHSCLCDDMTSPCLAVKITSWIFVRCQERHTRLWKKNNKKNNLMCCFTAKIYHAGRLWRRCDAGNHLHIKRGINVIRTTINMQIDTYCRLKKHFGGGWQFTTGPGGNLKQRQRVQPNTR